MNWTQRERRLLGALERVIKEAKKSKPDVDKIHEIAGAAIEYEDR